MGNAVADGFVGAAGPRIRLFQVRTAAFDRCWTVRDVQNSF
jgi:hypothetical protein